MSNRPNTKSSARRAPSRSAAPDRRPLLIGIGALILVVALGVMVAMIRSGDDGSSGLVFGPVEVTGGGLPGFEPAAQPDPAVGAAAPTLAGRTLADEPVSVGGAGQPTLVVFLAHWCSHCQAELPVLVDMAEAGAFDDIRTVAVLTGTDRQKPNFPPERWLEREGWTGDVLVDSEEETAAKAYGLAGYPFMVMLDADGNVTARSSGEKPADQVAALVATGTSTGSDPGS